MAIMGSYDGLDYLGDTISWFTKVSLGNMGFSTSICSKGIIDWNDSDSEMALMFQCQGSTTIGSIINTGLMYDDEMVNGIDN